MQVAHYGPADLADTKATWLIRDPSGREYFRGILSAGRIPTGTVTTLGKISAPLATLEQPLKLNLEISLDGTDIANDWDFWVYPAKANDDQVPSNITVSHALEDAAQQTLRGGGAVLWLIDPKLVAGNTYGSFEPIFWNRITFPQQKQHTLGVLCDPKHPAFALFPTDAHSNWQWWDIQQRGRPMVLDALPKQTRPIVQMIDDWTQCRKLALVFEAKVGAGKLLVCSIDLEHDVDARPAARQLRRSLLHYIASGDFAPAVDVSIEQLKALVTDASAGK